MGLVRRVLYGNNERYLFFWGTNKSFPEGELGGFVAMAELELGQDIAHVALDGVDADREGLSDLLIGRSGCCQAENFLLAVGQGDDFFLGNPWRTTAQAAKLFEHTAAKGRGDGGFAAGGSTEHGQELLRANTFEQVALGAIFDRFKQLLIIGLDCEHDDDDLGQFFLDRFGSLNAVAAGHADIHEDYVWQQFFSHDGDFKAIACFADDFEITLGIEDIRQSFAKELVVIGQEDALLLHQDRKNSSKGD